jgi:sulfur-carrier protein
MRDMARVTVELPSLLRDVLHKDSLHVEGLTLEDALEDAYTQLPGLRVHVCDESGRLRQHVLCFLNDTNMRGPDSVKHPLSDGDTITILQAVSGG